MRLLVSLMISCLAPAVVGQSADTMTAVRIHEFGGAEVLKIEQAPRPTPGPGELLVRVHAASVNPIDTQVRAGSAQSIASASFPYIPGFDLSGVVVAVGEGVTRFAVGEGVFAMLHLARGGAHAEYAVVREGEAARKPAGLRHVEAASLPLVAKTAWQALIETAGLQPGQSVLIHAGAGGVGSMAIQIAKWRGATVYTTASEGNHELLTALGADVVIDYRSRRFEEAARDIDVVLDTLGGSTQVRSLTTMRDGGVLVSLVGLEAGAREPDRGLRTTAILVRPDAGHLGQIAALVEEGSVRPIVSQVLPLSAVAAAHRMSETGRTRGKIVLAVSAEEAVAAVARDYILGWYDGDARRMESSLHPDLVKRRMARRPTGTAIEQMSSAELVAMTAAGGGRATPPARRRAEVRVLDVFGETASVRVDADDWIDYMHLVRWNGEWKIVNVLWELRIDVSVGSGPDLGEPGTGGLRG